MRLVISIVTYRSDHRLFLDTLTALCDAVRYAKARLPELKSGLFVIENEVCSKTNLMQAEKFFEDAETSDLDYIRLKAHGRNLGYGGGHNLAFAEAEDGDFYLVLNPDLTLAIDAIYQGLKYMEQNPSVALVSPAATDGRGGRLHLCKRFPPIVDLILRGFAPSWVRSKFRTRLEHYEMHELVDSKEPVRGIPIVSGCCMLLRRDVYSAVGGFDERFFLYFEDFDLSLRVRAIAEIVYLPHMNVVHLGGHAAKKGLKHIGHFAVSAVKFYFRYRWVWY